jgi:hypothetical protein
LRMSQCQPADEPRQLVIFPRPNHQVPVVAHQTIRQKPCPRPSHRLLEHPLERDEVLVFRKDWHPRVGAVQDMINPTTWS